MMSVFVSLLFTVRSSVRSRAALQIEVFALRHQLHVLQRSRSQRVRLTPMDRFLWVCLSRTWTDWRAALLVRPQTVIAWHRQGFRLFWRWKSRRAGRPTVPAEVRALIRTMSEDYPLWGAPRIHGEILKLGVDASQATVAKDMVRRGRPPSQTHVPGESCSADRGGRFLCCADRDISAAVRVGDSRS
jgi:putative transposase